MSNEVALNQDFKEKLFERIRTNIGDLLTDEQASELVKAAMMREFFEPVREYRTYGSDILHPPKIQGLVGDALKEQTQAAVAAFVAENHDEIMKMIEEQLREGMFGLVRGAINDHFAGSMETLKFNILRDLQSFG